SLVTAPLWLLGPGAGYAAVKVLGAACVSATAVAAHALAQRLAPGWPAAAAALAAALLPATVFGSAVDPSALAYPLCAAGALAAAAAAGAGRVVASGRGSWGALAIGTAVIPFAAALACGLALVRVRRAEGVIALVTIPLAALGAGVLAQAQGTDGRPAAEAAV